MLRKPLITLMITVNFVCAQNTVGTIEINNDAHIGYTLFTAFTETYLINNCGEVINQWTSNFPPGNAVYLLENGTILRAGRTTTADITFGGQGGVVEIFDWDGTLIWQYFYDTPMMRQHHDVYPMPNGNLLILAATRVVNNEAINAGRNPALLTETDLYNEQIIEVIPVGLNGADIIWEWNVKDHFIQDFDNSKANFGDVELSPEKLDINFLNGGSGGSNWLHFNSIQYNDELDQIVISSRNLSEIYIIDHSTTIAQAASNTGGTYGKGGDFLYRWGNPQSYKQGTELDRQLYGQHYAYVIESGLTDENKIILYNNGNGRTPLFSEVFVLNPPIDSPGVYSYSQNTAYGPLEPDYIYTDPILATDFYSRILSSAQRLQNGNTLICEGINGRFFEITPTEEIVWEYINPVSNTNGSISSQGDNPDSISNTSFRAIKYNMDYAAFTGRDLTPSDPIELNPDLTPCNNLSFSDFNYLSVSIYPNPTTDKIQIKSSLPIDKVEIYSLLGELIETTDQTNIDFSLRMNSIYFLKIYSQNRSITQKIIKN